MKWRRETTKSLLGEPVFQDLIRNSSLEVKDWQQAIRRFYINHYNNVFLPALRRAAPAQSHATSSISSPSASPILNSPAGQPTSKSLEDLYRRALVVFLGDLSPREMFASENEDAIRRQMEVIQAENPDSDLVGGGLRNKALKILWAKADQDLWKAKMEKLAGDIDANRDDFPALIFHAIQNLCARKRLGSTLMSFSWAFRDDKNDGIKGGTVITGYDAYKQSLIADNCKPIDHQAQLESWFNHADAILSRKPRTSVYKIPINEDGVPILPSVNVQEASASQVAILLDEYILSLWDFSWAGSENMPAIPWEDITHNPHHYFDTSIYKFPCALRPPQDLKSNPLEIFGVHQFLSSTATSTPFRFRSYLELLKVNSLDDDDDSDNEDSQLPPPSRAFTGLSLPLDSLDAVKSASAPDGQVSLDDVGVPVPIPGTQDLPDTSSNPSSVNLSTSTSNVNGPAAEPSSPVPPVHPTQSNSPISREPAVTNSASVEQPAGTKSAKKTKKGVQKRKAKAPAPVAGDGGDVSASRTSTRTSVRAANSKRKVPDTDSTTTEKPQPTKKTRVGDRWEYVIVVPGAVKEK
ncbi:hypothetical protein GALMADRAFT_244867 [Galerina marginata CBS 339.88]|uniref:Uncharacterized protein n=1 Tax=Galerina marginata (strain CBS 339.88) TaxID=685588 RepID=A0A067T458_GALM3|nr:hypothetical protein GALMADRAFT_244867 [Galerina marginata CBS 339.88]